MTLRQAQGRQKEGTARRAPTGGAEKDWIQYILQIIQNISSDYSEYDPTKEKEKYEILQLWCKESFQNDREFIGGYALILLIYRVENDIIKQVKIGKIEKDRRHINDFKSSFINCRNMFNYFNDCISYILPQNI